MKARGMVGLIAFGLALLATVAVFLYVHGVRQQAETGGRTVSVVVAKRDIAAGTSMDSVIAGGGFTTSTIPKTAEVTGAVTSLAELRGHRASTPILAGEQIPRARLQGSTELPGGPLGIPRGYEAVTLQLDTPRAAGGLVRGGDRVQVFATFQNSNGTGGQNVTVTLVPDVRVLRATKPGGIDHPATTSLMVTMALKPRDSQKLVFAEENGFVWLGLLAPGEPGTAKPPLTIAGVTH